MVGHREAETVAWVWLRQVLASRSPNNTPQKLNSGGSGGAARAQEGRPSLPHSATSSNYSKSSMSSRTASSRSAASSSHRSVLESQASRSAVAGGVDTLVEMDEYDPEDTDDEGSSDPWTIAAFPSTSFPSASIQPPLPNNASERPLITPRDGHPTGEAGAAETKEEEEKKRVDPSLETMAVHEFNSYVDVVALIVKHTPFTCGWKEPWIVQKQWITMKNLEKYRVQTGFEYPTQSLVYDHYHATIREKYAVRNRGNLLADSFLVSTRSKGYFLGNPRNGCWYALGEERPHNVHLHRAQARGSMAVDLFPRSSRVYFAGGLVMGMPISTVAELDLESMRLGPVCEMRLPRAFTSMVFFPDSLVLLGGTNGWDQVYSEVEFYNFMKDRWRKTSPLLFPRYGAGAIALETRFIFVAGGCDRYYPVLETEWFDRCTEQWMSPASLLAPMSNCHMLRYRQFMYLAGARERLTQFFDPSKTLWCLAGKLNHQYRAPKLAILGDRLICSGANIMHYEILDDRLNMWVATNARNHPLGNRYPPPLELPEREVIHWYHLGRRYW